jgi:signal transduction histidine kinase
MAQTASNNSARGPFRRRKQLEQDLEHVTQEMYRRNRELAETNQTLSLLRTIDTMVLESQEPLQTVCMQIARAITETTEYPFMALLTRPAGEDELELYGWSAKNQQLPDTLFGAKIPKVHLDDINWFAAPSSSQLIAVDTFDPARIARLCNCSQTTVAHIRKRLPIKSLYVVKLRARGRLVGVMAAGFFGETTTVSAQDMQRLDQLSEPVGIALDNRLLFEENRRVLFQLKRSNTKLKMLDETKDDFISMASHQLRTPLTSVKGYLSMVLEGDAGKVNATQKKMLTQAYTSSQRMVYLIADLLNVSRLRTGKFIIEPIATDLSEIVQQEIEQLTETAAARDVKLTYARPKAFPQLLLDETKTRQVIMNFVDNAIYYTPAGGKIKVELSETPTAIELRVTDTGMGVPKSEQHHLFTKFYRAHNAQKARPDGTGLGLYMAKKVVVAQDGSIIFESHEGKGSTFGFSFPKKRLATLKPSTGGPAALKPAKRSAK